MADLVSASAQAIADALAPSPQAPAARWRWGSVVSVNADGTMNVSIGGATVPSIRCAQHVMGAQVGDRVRVLYLGTEAMVDAVRATSDLMSVPSPSMDVDTKAAWLDALGLTTETIHETSGITIKRFGRMVMVQCHGVSGTANNNVPLANVDMSAYKPSYNASTIVCDTQSTTHFARLWVSTGDGKPYLAFAGYSGASTWYGTLAYIY